jgi:hypothetical protein
MLKRELSQRMNGDRSVFVQRITLAGLTALTMSMSAGCSSEPDDVTYLAVGSDVQQQELERGSYRSTNPAVLSVLEMKDTSRSGCSGINLFGCPNNEIAIERTLIAFQGVAPGEASIVGKREDGKEVSLDFRIEEVRDIQVRRVVTPNDNDSPEVDVASNEELALDASAPSVLQINLLGDSQIALGYLKTFDVVSQDAGILTVEHSGSSHGYRAHLKAVSPGTTSIIVSTPTVSRTLAIRVEPSR